MYSVFGMQMDNNIYISVIYSFFISNVLVQMGNKNNFTSLTKIFLLYTFLDAKYGQAFLNVDTYI